ncbi:hypothetical protein, partial [Pontibacillus litoralis]|uniref:hypothetical protein n=1 Tax=Pontibacillus litoralis TaxID=516703 RepID=UPI001E531199
MDNLSQVYLTGLHKMLLKFSSSHSPYYGLVLGYLSTYTRNEILNNSYVESIETFTDVLIKAIENSDI